MKGDSVAKANENTVNDLDSYVDKLLERASTTGSVTEDEIQIVLKDVDVSDTELTGIYSTLRDRGVDIVSQGDDDAEAPLDSDDTVLGDDLDDVTDLASSSTMKITGLAISSGSHTITVDVVVSFTGDNGADYTVSGTATIRTA